MPKTMAEMVSVFLDRQRFRPFEPGVCDCTLDLADWAVFLGFPDPAAEFRGTYNDEAGFRAILKAQGGLVALVDRHALALAGKRLERPIAGAVGVIGSPRHHEMQWGAIYDGRQWQTRIGPDSSLAPLSARILTMWSIGTDRVCR